MTCSSRLLALGEQGPWAQWRGAFFERLPLLWCFMSSSILPCFTGNSAHQLHKRQHFTSSFFSLQMSSEWNEQSCVSLLACHMWQALGTHKTSLFTQEKYTPGCANTAHGRFLWLSCLSLSLHILKSSHFILALLLWHLHFTAEGHETTRNWVCPCSRQRKVYGQICSH